MERRHGMRPQQILVVDDSAEIRELWRIWLNFWGFGVQEARNGAEAEAILSSSMCSMEILR